MDCMIALYTGGVQGRKQLNKIGLPYMILLLIFSSTVRLSFSDVQWVYEKPVSVATIALSSSTV